MEESLDDMSLIIVVSLFVASLTIHGRESFARGEEEEAKEGSKEAIEERGGTNPTRSSKGSSAEWTS